MRCLEKQKESNHKTVFGSIAIINTFNDDSDEMPLFFTIIFKSEKSNNNKESNTEKEIKSPIIG